MAAENISLAEQAHRLVDKLDRSVNLHARDIEREMDQVQRDTARLRDDLIECRRSGAAGASVADAALEAVNIALSLIVSVEYPVTSIQRKALERARDVLKPLARS